MNTADGNPIGIIGAGRLGHAMARTALRAGRSVVISNSRGPDSLRAVVSGFGEGVTAGTVEEAAAAATVVVAVPWSRVPEAVRGPEWNGRIVIDANQRQATDSAYTPLSRPHRRHQGGINQMSITETQALPAGTWSVDRVHSTVGFAVEYMAGTFTGTFSDFDADVGDGVLKGSAKVASVQVKDPNLEAHLQSPDFFDAERHSELTFRSSSIERKGDELRIDGEITIKGHTEPVEITGTISEPIPDPYGGTRFGLKLRTTIDRDRFGISWNNPLPGGEPALANDVVLTTELQLTKQA